MIRGHEREGVKHLDEGESGDSERYEQVFLRPAERSRNFGNSVMHKYRYRRIRADNRPRGQTDRERERETGS